VLDGRYRIEALLGEGAMGSVYRARQLNVDRPVALKLLRPDAAGGPEAIARFREEMRATSRIEHPNTIRLYDSGEHAGRLFLVMELIDGPTLRRVIDKEGPQPLSRALHIGLQIANALGAAHDRGIVHRDLKPDNIMLVDVYGNGDFVKVVDFGIAKSLDQLRPHLTVTGTVIGTPAYMAPEQAAGEPPDLRTDLYALGIILYEMVSGVVPFQKATTVSMLMAHASEPPPPIETRVPNLHARLAGLIMRLLAKPREERPRSALEVASELEACAADAGILLRRPSGHIHSATPAGGVQAGGTALLPQTPSVPRPPVAAGGTAMLSEPSPRSAAPPSASRGTGSSQLPGGVTRSIAQSPPQKLSARRWVLPLVFGGLALLLVGGGAIALVLRWLGHLR
jgi:serine/threonine-protein kinase